MAASRCSLLLTGGKRCLWDSLRAGRQARRKILSWTRRGCGLAAPRSITTCAARPVDAKVMEAPSFAGTDEAMRKAEYRLNRSYIGRFWDWLTTETLDEPEMAEGEKEEREDLLQRVEAMYFSDPPVTPDLGFYKEVFQMLVKYKDRIGCITLWRVMKELGVEPDAELTALVEPFLERAQKGAWLE